jgi:hypothetical protein
MFKHAIAFRAAHNGFTFHNPIDYPCPVCGALVKRRCRKPSGQVINYHRSCVRRSKKPLGRPRRSHNEPDVAPSAVLERAP